MQSNQPELGGAILKGSLQHFLAAFAVPVVVIVAGAVLNTRGVTHELVLILLILNSIGLGAIFLFHQVVLLIALAIEHHRRVFGSKDSAGNPGDAPLPSGWRDTRIASGEREERLTLSPTSSQQKGITALPEGGARAVRSARANTPPETDLATDLLTAVIVADLVALCLLFGVLAWNKVEMHEVLPYFLLPLVGYYGVWLFVRRVRDVLAPLPEVGTPSLPETSERPGGTPHWPRSGLEVDRWRLPGICSSTRLVAERLVCWFRPRTDRWYPRTPGGHSGNPEEREEGFRGARPEIRPRAFNSLPPTSAQRPDPRYSAPGRTAGPRLPSP